MRYHKALLADIKNSGRVYAQAKPYIRSIYFGGGTPTLVPADKLAEVLGTLRELFSFCTDTEVTVEANPGTLTLDGLSILRRAGANRLSMGVQSLEDRILHRLGRIHSAEDVAESALAARQAGFDNINFDLIYGLPGQNCADWKQTLEGILDLKPQHLSCYALSVEEGTPLQRGLEQGVFTLPSEYEICRMESLIRRKLPAAGFRHYEISNWSRRGFCCRHNLEYWANGDYIGWGAGAVSYYNRWRFKRQPNPEKYIDAVNGDGSLYTEAERLGSAETLRETVILGLRRRRGINVRALADNFEEPLRSRLYDVFAGFFAEFPAGLMFFKDGRLRLSGRGRDISNEIFVRLLENKGIEAAFASSIPHEAYP